MRFALAAAIVIAAPPALAQATPEAALTRFITLANAGELTTPAGQAILTGEAKQMATAAKSNLAPADRIIRIAPDKAAARIVLRGQADEEADAYFYLDKVGAAWAVSAYRAMPRAVIDTMLLNELKKRRELSADEQASQRNLTLILSTDTQLRAWFKANRAALDDLAKTAKAEPAALAALGIETVDPGGGSVVLTIGATSGATVGLVRSGASGPPAIDPASYIWVEDLGGGWFLFRRV
jgi:hypothetical protein